MNEVQTVDVALLPYTPAVQKIVVSSPPSYGDSLTITTSGAPYQPHIETITISVPPSNQVQNVTISQNFVPPAVATLTLGNTGQVREVQVLNTSVVPVSEVQAIILQTSFWTYNTSYSETVAITYKYASGNNGAGDSI